MSDVPNGWVKATIGDLAEYINGMAFKPEDWEAEGRPIIRIQNLSDPSRPFNRTRKSVREQFVVRASDILVSWSATLDAFVWRGEDAVLNQHIFRVLPNTKIIDRDFLFYQLRIAIREMVETEHLHGSTMKHINRGPFLAHEVCVPPAHEQRRIVAKIDSLSAMSKRARDRLDHVLRLVARYKEAVLREALSGSLTKPWREQQQAPTPVWRSLSEVADDFSYGSAAKSSASGKCPVLRMGNIQDGQLDWSDLVYSSNEREIEKFSLRKGDVLFNRTNSPALVGKTALYQGEREAIYAGYLIRIRCKADLDPAFLTFSLNSPLGRAYCWAVKTDGVSQSNISAKKIAAFQLLIPSIGEQREIVRRIKAAFAWIDRLAVEATGARKLIDRLDHAVLAKAFRGELVPQDPADEPASVLLKRIKAARDETEPAVKRRGRPRLATSP